MKRGEVAAGSVNRLNAADRGNRSTSGLVRRRVFQPRAPSPGLGTAEEDRRSPEQAAGRAHEVSPDTGLGQGQKLLIVLFVVALLLPFSVSVGTVRMTPNLLYLALTFFPLIAAWLFRRNAQPGLVDYIVLAFWAWAAVAVGINHGFLSSVEPIGMHLLQTVGAFAAGRILVRNAASMAFMAKVVVIAACVCAALAVVESVTGQKVALRLAGMIGPSWPGVEMSPRMGLARAQTVFEHPILFGIFSASIFSIAYYCLPRSRIMSKGGALAAAIGAFTSLSTGALLSLNVQFGLMAWNFVFKGWRNRWKLLLAAIAVAYVLVDLASTRSPFHVFVNYGTFSSSSSYNRILIWQFGSAEALRNPFFGIGFGEWERPSYMSNSMDNFWLVQAVRYGMPACFMLMGLMILIVARALRAEGPDASGNRMRRGAAFALIATCVSIGSVHLWNATYVWLMFLAGSSVWLGSKGEAGKQQLADSDPAEEDTSPAGVEPVKRGRPNRPRWA